MYNTILKTSILSLLSLGTFAQTVNIPDANFKAFLLGQASINTNSDSEIQVSEAMNFNGSIAISNLGIADLTGIEFFPNITGLTCDFNNLTSLDVSANTSLISLICNNNSIISLNTTGCTLITSIAASSNNITSVDFSTNTALQIANVGINNLTSLDLTSNVNLTDVYCFNNNLTSLNVANGNNTNISGFVATGNSSLSCIQVDDVAYSTANWTNIDPGASFSLNCCTVTIPDANFKAYLVGNTSINTNADSEIQCSEASSFTGTINCQNMNISDLTGIEAFTSLTSLLCGDNPLGTIDVSQNMALMTFQPYNNNLSTLDITANTALGNLVCFGNSFTTLDVSQNTSLNLFVCRKNNLTTLDVSNNPSLSIFICDSNDLTSLDLSANTGLTNFNCSYNDLTTLNLSNVDPTTSSLDATSNPNLTCITVDDVSIAQTNWTNIDVTASFSTNCNTTSTHKDYPILKEVNIYPNPVQNQLKIEYEGEITNTAIIDANGKIVKTFNTSSTLDVSELDGGVYFLQIFSKESVITERFLKM